MARFTVRKAIHFSDAQAAELERIAALPQYQYNDEPSVAAVVRDAVSLFLSQLSMTVDNDQRQPAPEKVA